MGLGSNVDGKQRSAGSVVPREGESDGKEEIDLVGFEGENLSRWENKTVLNEEATNRLRRYTQLV